MARQLEGKEAAGTQHPNELSEIGVNQLRVGHVLKHDARIDGVERRVAELPQVRFNIQHEGAVPTVGVDSARFLDHPLGNVDADGLVEAFRERARQAAGAAAEVERAPLRTRDSQLRRLSENCVDLRPPAREERLALAFLEPLLGVRQDRPVEVDLRQVIPVAAETVEPQG
jgi:hypothetical protein